ncbi:MAG: carbohydrate ABC transporter permease [Bacillota bacterium]
MREQGKTRLGSLVIYLILVVYAVVSVGPFLWSVSISFARTEEVDLLTSNGFLPPHPTLDNYRLYLNQPLFLRWVMNSFLVAGVTTLGLLAFNSLAGYALARIRFPGRNFFFWLILATMMVPSVVIIVPQYVLLNKLGWLNSYQGLTVPFMANAFGVFLMRQFFLSIPADLEEAARLDGLSRFGIFWRVILPLARPALAAQLIFQFLGQWNGFMWPFLIARAPEMFTLTVGLQSFKAVYYSFWNQVLAGSMFLTVPVVIVFLIFQRWFVQGITLTGMKG